MNDHICLYRLDNPYCVKCGRLHDVPEIFCENSDIWRFGAVRIVEVKNMPTKEEILKKANERLDKANQRLAILISRLEDRLLEAEAKVRELGTVKRNVKFMTRHTVKGRRK